MLVEGGFGASRLSLASAQSDDLQALLAEQQVEGAIKATSSARLLSAMRRLFQHLYREDSREDDPKVRCWRPQNFPAAAERSQRSKLKIILVTCC